ncbi:MAG: hypothetical protein JXB10_12395 [Pirellulales bacterium]|nr:hypothetical protein [Pirellulales bacterium]
MILHLLLSLFLMTWIGGVASDTPMDNGLAHQPAVVSASPTSGCTCPCCPDCDCGPDCPCPGCDCGTAVKACTQDGVCPCGTDCPCPVCTCGT